VVPNRSNWASVYNHNFKANVVLTPSGGSECLLRMVGVLSFRQAYCAVGLHRKVVLSRTYEVIHDRENGRFFRSAMDFKGLPAFSKPVQTIICGKLLDELRRLRTRPIPGWMAVIRRAAVRLVRTAALG
jgi:hypothetical protein